MRGIARIYLVVALILPAAITFAQEPAKLAEPDRTFKLQDTVRITVTGFQDEINVVDGRAANVWLVLDDVIMKSLGTPLAERGLSPNEVVVSYRLSLNQDDADSRNEWKRLLEKQETYEMRLPMALALEGEASLPVSGAGLNFSITTSKRATLTLLAGLVLFTGCFWVLARSKTALRDWPDGPYSLGKSQMTFWGLLVVLAFVGVWVNTGLMTYIPEEVLTLVGISGATGLGAVLIGDSAKAAEIAKLESELKLLDPGAHAARTTEIADRLQALIVPKEASEGILYDICNDGNGVSFHRLQAVLWTLVLGFVFVRTVAQVISMPVFSETLLILMGISNSTYLGFKFKEPS